MTIFHPLHTDTLPPRQFTYPFCYEPHPLCQMAADEVRRHIGKQHLMEGETGGKMFGVLVVACNAKRSATDKAPSTSIGFLAAYSGLLAGRGDWPWFVPSVYDAQAPDGHFKTEERRISGINTRIRQREQSPLRQEIVYGRDQAITARDRAIAAYKERMAEAKVRRDLLRNANPPIGADEQAALIRESQHMKAELRRLRQAHAAHIEAAEERLREYDTETETLRQERRAASEQLQAWLFSQYNLLDANGQRHRLTDIFADTPQHTPPSGAGDCCAPKLLQYAYLHGLRPLCMAEFWVGPSPQGEIRHDGQYYPACRSKCLPILTHMLRGLDVEPNPLAADNGKSIEVVYEDDALAVVYKPDDLLSVPGTTDRASVYSLARRRWPKADGPLVVHRLDMATSGLMLIAKSLDIYRRLQDQFLHHDIRKEYEAVLDGTPKAAPKGQIRLPLRPDPSDRPRQVVDPIHGKPSVTEYEILGTDGHTTRLLLRPVTGRTHQLRVHCAHADGLACPIVGDTLYGHAARRLMLHAGRITFTHPVSGKEMTFYMKPRW